MSLNRLKEEILRKKRALDAQVSSGPKYLRQKQDSQIEDLMPEQRSEGESEGEGETVVKVKVEMEKVKVKEDPYLDCEAELPDDFDQITSRSLLCYLKGLLKEWKDQSVSDKQAECIYSQALEHIQPLFGLLADDRLSNDMFRHVATICRYMKAREYLRANDAYLQLAIGNSPWPIGVTMVGIHERSAREKISSNQVAHVLNDETQRKWIHAIKRILTFCQSKYPPKPTA
jgi:pre-mRNA-splicing factor 18